MCKIISFLVHTRLDPLLKDINIYLPRFSLILNYIHIDIHDSFFICVQSHLNVFSIVDQYFTYKKII